MVAKGVWGAIGAWLARSFGSGKASAPAADAQLPPPAFAPVVPEAPRPSADPFDVDADALRAAVLAALPYQVLTVPGDTALAEWERLRAAGESWPVILGGEDGLTFLAEQFGFDGLPDLPSGDPRDVPAILRASEDVRLPEAMRARFEEATVPPMAPVEALPLPERGEWPDAAPEPTGLTVVRNLLSNRPHDHVYIALLPTRNGWEAPAYLYWGGWNDCPDPALHVAQLRSWHERYGAELVGLNADTFNLRVSRRPESREEALALAEEQYFYCTDIVDQGTETLSVLAAALMADDWWYFWWD